MNSEQKAHYEQLETIPERAWFLLGLGITARTDIQDGDQGPELVTCAFAGDFKLPITGATESACIAKAEDWLFELASSGTAQETASV